LSAVLPAVYSSFADRHSPSLSSQIGQTFLFLFETGYHCFSVQVDFSTRLCNVMNDNTDLGDGFRGCTNTDLGDAVIPLVPTAGEMFIADMDTNGYSYTHLIGVYRSFLSMMLQNEKIPAHYNNHTTYPSNSC
jgi:hypothetical protein